MPRQGRQPIALQKAFDREVHHARIPAGCWHFQTFRVHVEVCGTAERWNATYTRKGLTRLLRFLRKNTRNAFGQHSPCVRILYLCSHESSLHTLRPKPSLILNPKPSGAGLRASIAKCTAKAFCYTGTVTSMCFGGTMPDADVSHSLNS